MLGNRQAPPPPPHAALPEDFRDLQQQSSMDRQQQLLEARKREMQTELERSLKELDGERKEGLYRLDWELAEAIENLHAQHADRANHMVRQHKETISMMEKRAQTGEHLTQEKVQALRSPVQASVRYRDQSEDPDYTDESDSDSSDDDSEEGFFSRIVSMVRGDPPQRRAPRAHEDNQNNGYNDRADGNNLYGSPKTQYELEGANANGYGMPASSPLSMPAGPLSQGSPTHATEASFAIDLPPLLPFAKGGGQRSRWPPPNVYHGNGY